LREGFIVWALQDKFASLDDRLHNLPGILADNLDRIVALDYRAGIDETAVHQHPVAINIVGMDCRANPENIVGSSGSDDRDWTVQIVKCCVRLLRHQRYRATNPSVVATDGPILEVEDFARLRSRSGGGSAKRRKNSGDETDRRHNCNLASLTDNR